MIRLGALLLEGITLGHAKHCFIELNRGGLQHHFPAWEDECTRESWLVKQIFWSTVLREFYVGICSENQSYQRIVALWMWLRKQFHTFRIKSKGFQVKQVSFDTLQYWRCIEHAGVQQILQYARDQKVAVISQPIAKGLKSPDKSNLAMQHDRDNDENQVDIQRFFSIQL